MKSISHSVMPLGVVFALATSSFHLEAETVSTWDQLKDAIADPGKSHTLGNGLIIDSSTGQIEIPAGSSLTLNGGGFSITSENSLGDRKPIFSNAGELNFSGLSFAGNGSQTTVDSPTQKTEANSYGGAIYNTGKLTISGVSSFIGNVAAALGTKSTGPSDLNLVTNACGGAIYNANTADTQTFSNTLFSQNKVLATITGSTIRGKNEYQSYGSPVPGSKYSTANAYGGAIYNEGSMSFKSTVFFGNSAEAKIDFNYSLASYAQGGAIYNTATSGQTKIVGGIFVNNFASSLLDNYPIDSSSMDRDPESLRPHAQGGAIYQGGGDLIVSGTRFEGNYVTTSSQNAYSTGGAVYNLGNARFEDVVFADNYAQSTSTAASYVSAGAVYNGKTGVMEIIRTSFTGNHAIAAIEWVPENWNSPASGSASTGAINNDGGVLAISNSEFTGNFAMVTGGDRTSISAYAGAIRNSSATSGILAIAATSFTGNHASAIGANSSSANSGAISNQGKASLEISQGSTFTGNYATAGKLAYGGAVSSNSLGTIRIQDATFEGNYAEASMSNGESVAQGGAIYDTGAGATLISTDFIQNHVEAALNAMGGAVYREKKVDIIGGTFTGNYALALNNATGGAAYFKVSSPEKTVIAGVAFSDNYAEAAANASGGAIYNLGMFRQEPGGGTYFGQFVLSTLAVSDAVFTGNHVIAGANGYGGAIYHKDGVLAFSNVTFAGNYVSSPEDKAGAANLYGGAIFNQGFLSIINSTFENNYTMAGTNSFGGAIYGNGQTISIVADGQDTIFRGNRQGVTSVDADGKPLDGESNAIYVRQGAVSLYTSKNGSVIFYDSLFSDGLGCLNINSGNNEGYPTSGTAYFKDGVAIENFNVELSNGVMSMGDDTKIKGDVFAHNGATFLICGFTKLEGNYMLMKGGEGGHTVYVDMDDSMINRYSEEKPVWDFNNGQSSLQNVTGQKLDFILDIADIINFPEHLRPYIFSHFGQTEELMENVRNSANVTIMDGDGWTYRIPEIYVDGDRTLDYFDFLSGQYGLYYPFGPDSPGWNAPTGVGSAQVETLWTTTRSLWSFADGARTQNKTRLRHNRDTAIWISGLGNYFTQENQPHMMGYRYRSWGTSVGGEYTFAPEWTAGAAIGEIWGRHDLNFGMGNIDKDATLALLYLNRDIKLDKTNTLSINLQGGYENSRNKGDIRMNQLVSDTLYGKWRDQAWMADLRVTWTRPLNERTLLDTFAGFQYTYAEQGDSTLMGGKNRNFRLVDGSMYDFRAAIGTGVRHSREIRNHATLFYARAGLIQDIQREVPHISVIGSRRNWTAVGSKPGRTAFNFNAGSSVQIVDKWSMGIDYTLEAANKSLMQTGRISLMCEF